MANLAYNIQGQGFPVVFLHGFCENKEIWQEFIIPFASDFRSVIVDMPGFGKSTANTNYQSTDALAEEVATLLQGLGITQAVIIGHSLGGYVALALADKYPELMAGLGLFHSTAFSDSDEKKHGRNKMADFIRDNGMVPFLKDFVSGLFYKERHEALAQTMKEMEQITAQTPADTAFAVTLAMRDRPDRTHVLRQAAYPVLFIAGKHDEAVPLETAKEQFYLPGHAIVQILADTAHMGMFEQLPQTRAMIQAFVHICISLQ